MRGDDGTCKAIEIMARETGLEPATSGVTGRHSNQLSYSRSGPIRSLRERLGLKGANNPSQGHYKCPSPPDLFPPLMQKIPCLWAKHHGQIRAESTNPCGIVNSVKPVPNEEGKIWRRKTRPHPPSRSSTLPPPWRKT